MLGPTLRGFLRLINLEAKRQIEQVVRVLGIPKGLELKRPHAKVLGVLYLAAKLADGADRLAQALDEADWTAPSTTVISNVSAKPHDPADIESIKTSLVDQLTHPVRWAESMAWAVENSPGRYIELAPGRVLGGLMRRIDRKTKVENFAEPPKVAS